MRFYFKIVIVGDALGRRLRVVTAAAVFIRENGTYSLLVAKRGFDDDKAHGLRLAGCNCAKLVSSGDGPQSDRRGCLSAGIGEHHCWVKGDARGAMKLHQCAG